MKILKVIIETGEPNYSAYIDGVSGIGVTSRTVQEIKDKIRDIVDFHIEVAKETNRDIPELLKGDFDFVFELEAELSVESYDTILQHAHA